MKHVILTLLIIVVFATAGWLFLIYSGSYNVSMTNHDNAFVNWAFNTGAARSVKRHAASIMPPPLDDPIKIQNGAKHFQEMCAMCHGAPGQEAGEIAKGLWPEAPDLKKAVPDWSPGELFWITKNGIKFTAMPAWGPTHNDEKIWEIVAFLEKLPSLSPSDYEQLQTSTSQKR